MWRTEVNIGAQTWAISTSRIGLDPTTGEDEFDTTITEPGEAASKSIRHNATLQQARRVHDSFVADYSWQFGAVVVEYPCHPRRF